MIDVKTAAELLDLGARLRNPQRAEEQLHGAVALHHLLSEHRVGYLADEVGMGKTYVALGAMALFRHFDPGFRVLFIAPRENIQQKWMKELQNFIRHNVRFPDMRVKGIDDGPARALARCDNLIELVHAASVDPNRDFFVRMSSFSVPLANDKAAWWKLRDRLRRELPWLADEIFAHSDKEDFKDSFARAICCALPVFDLVIVDEAHNLKHGFGEGGSSRNRVLGLALGRETPRPARSLFPGYGPRARRVLFLSATPIEESYRQLWNQLDLFGLGKGFEALREGGVDEEEKKRLAARFLIRRVTTIRVGQEEYTKNRYRREWRAGGVTHHDEPIRIEDPRQRLAVALVQKKVSEILGHTRFNDSFQIGMLASFESFLETAKAKRRDQEEGTFDDPDQTDAPDERDGVDVDVVDKLARDHRKRFDRELPHPKMDAVVKGLSDAWITGRKALVFVRRVASVKELKRKLDDQYDRWICGTIHDRLPVEVRGRFEQVYGRYRAEKELARAANRDGGAAARPAPGEGGEDVDPGGNDTFFAWYFRGEGPPGVISGANVQQRFTQQSGAYATFFEDNHVMALLGAQPGGVTAALAAALGMAEEPVRAELRRRSARFLRRTRRHERADRFEAVQAAAIELLAEHAGPLQERARVIWHERYEPARKRPSATDPPEVEDALERRTFWTELRRRRLLRDRLWPAPRVTDPWAAFREQELRAQLLATAARLGHAFLDLYVLIIQRLKSLELRAKDTSADDDGGELARIRDYLDLLERQMDTPPAERGWGAFDELAAMADHFDLILDVNDPKARNCTLSEATRRFAQLLRRQQPVGGMSGQVNQTLVRQFRLPGYPLILISTDLLQEGEDLHTFCSTVHHYGISWTPSSMEQRIGRIDRVLSETDRRLSGLGRPLEGNDMLQVYYPHLEDTVELLQVQRVLARMNTFLRMMHEGLSPPEPEQRKLVVGQEIAAGRRLVEQIREPLRSAFPVPTAALRGPLRALDVGPDLARSAQERFQRLRSDALGDLKITWEDRAPPGKLLGTLWLPRRQQPFALVLQSCGERLLIRCISPVGRVSPGEKQEDIAQGLAAVPARVGAILGQDERSYDLTVEDDVLLAGEEHDAARVVALVRRVATQADRLEQRHLPGRDEPLSAFQGELEREQGNAS